MTTRDRFVAARATAPTVTGQRPVGPVARLRTDEAGMATAEYAVATLAACGFAGLLVAVLSGGEVQQMLLSIVRRALTIE